MLRFGFHASQRLLERRVGYDDAELVVQEPDRAYHDPDGNPCFEKLVDGRWVKVVILGTDPEGVTVKTVIVLS